MWGPPWIMDIIHRLIETSNKNALACLSWTFSHLIVHAYKQQTFDEWIARNDQCTANMYKCACATNGVFKIWWHFLHMILCSYLERVLWKFAANMICSFCSSVHIKVSSFISEVVKMVGHPLVTRVPASSDPAIPTDTRNPHLASQRDPRPSPGRSVLKIHFFIESGLKMIQFKIQFKTKSGLFIQ